MDIIESHLIIDELFDEWKSTLGRDYLAYRCHAYRVFNLSCASIRAQGEEKEKLAMAAAFHDIGIWLDHTFDYLGPSVQRATDYLSIHGRVSWSEVISQIINQHHTVFPWHGPQQHLVESFRKADWFDVCLFSLPNNFEPSFLRQVLHAFPRNGFHIRLVQIALQWCCRHPFNPLPMVKL